MLWLTPLPCLSLSAPWTVRSDGDGGGDPDQQQQQQHQQQQQAMLEMQMQQQQQQQMQQQQQHQQQQQQHNSEQFLQAYLGTTQTRAPRSVHRAVCIWASLRCLAFVS